MKLQKFCKMLTLFILILSTSVFAENLTEIDICNLILVQDKITPVSDPNIRLIIWKPDGRPRLQGSRIEFNFPSLKSVCNYCFDANGVSKAFTKELKDYYPSMIGAYRLEKNQTLTPWMWDGDGTVIETRHYASAFITYGPVTSNDAERSWSIVADRNGSSFKWYAYPSENFPRDFSDHIYFACQRPFRPQCHSYKRYNWDGCELTEESGCHTYYTISVLDGDSTEGACTKLNDTVNKVFAEQCPDDRCICKVPVTQWSAWSGCTAKKCSDRKLRTRTRTFLKEHKCSPSHLRFPLTESRNCTVENCNLLKPMKKNMYDYDEF